LLDNGLVTERIHQYLVFVCAHNLLVSNALKDKMSRTSFFICAVDSGSGEQYLIQRLLKYRKQLMHGVQVLSIDAIYDATYPIAQCSRF